MNIKIDRLTREMWIICLVISLIFVGIFILSINGVSALGNSPICSNDNGCILKYQFNNVSGLENYGFSNVIFDSSSSKNNATNSSLINYNVSGDYLRDGAFLFNGTNNYITANNKTSLISGGNMTLSVWIMSSYDTSENVIIKTAFSSSKSGFIISTSTDQLKITLFNVTGNSSVVYATSYVDKPFQWSLINVVIYSNKSVCSYQDLDSLGCSEFPLGGNINLSDTITPRISDSSTASWNGSIGEIVIYNKSYSQFQLWDFYHTYFGCLNPLLNSRVFGNSVLCSGFNYVNSTIPYGIRIYNSGTNISGNNSIIIGNNTEPFIYGTNLSNISIQNLDIRNFDYGIYLLGLNNSLIINNNISNINKSFIYVTSPQSNVIKNNYIHDYLESGYYGIQLASDDFFNFTTGIYNNNSIVFNYLNHTHQGLIVQNGIYGTNISFNNLTYLDYNSIQVYRNASYSTISNNNIYFAGWNGIAIRSYNNNISNNNIMFAYHHDIDLYDNAGGNDLQCYGNNIINNIGLYNRNGHHIYIYNCTSSYFNNNTFMYNNVSYSSVSRNGFFVGSNFEQNSNYNNIIISDIYSYCIILGNGAKNNIFNNIVLSNCSVFDVKVDYNCSNNTFNNLQVYNFSKFYLSGNNSYNNFSGIYFNTSISGIVSLNNSLKDWIVIDSNGSANLFFGDIDYPLIYYNNLSGFYSNSENINLNISLLNNKIFILQNFNLTEGYNRLYSPITLTNTNRYQRVIRNNLNSNFKLNISLIYFYSTFVVSYPNGSNQKFTGINYSDFKLDVLSGLTYINAPMYSDIRIPDDNNYVGYSPLCSFSLVPYKYSYESGCSSYSGSECSDSMFGNAYKYTLLASNYNKVSPPWAYSNSSCLFKGVNWLGDIILVQAWRVNGNAGQYCSIQDKWNWFVYKYDSTYNNTNLTNSSYRDEIGYYDFPCYLSGDDTTSNDKNIHPQYFIVDFNRWIYIILLIIFFIIVLIFLYFRMFYFAGFLLMILGFVMLYSGILWIFSFIIIVLGVIILFIGRGYYVRYPK